MTVKQLIRALKDCKPEAEVHLAFQPTYPLKASIGNVVTLRDFEEEEEDDDEEGDLDDVWLVSGDEDGYASKKLWD